MRKIIILNVLLVSFLFSCKKEVPKNTNNAISDTIPTLKVTVTDSSYSAPSSIPAGLVNIKLVNNSSGMHAAHLIKLEEGYTSKQMIKAYSDSMRTGGIRPKWMTHRGGIISEPGNSDISLFLDAGNYTWVCVMGTDESPHFAGHEHQEVTVVKNSYKDNTIKLKEADVVINMTDENHQLNKPISAGQQTIKIINTGTKYHLVAISKLNKNATAADVIDWFKTYDGPPPAEGKIATSAIGPGLTATLDLEFDPGEYVLYCMANAEGKFHLLDGAITTFKVESHK